MKKDRKRKEESHDPNSQEYAADAVPVAVAGHAAGCLE